MKTATVLFLGMLCALTGCTAQSTAWMNQSGENFNRVPGWNGYTPEELAAMDDAKLVLDYGQFRHAYGDSDPKIAAMRAELQTRRFPEAWEWPHIDKCEVVPKMSSAGVNAVFGFSGDRGVIGCDVVEGAYEEGRSYQLRGKVWSIYQRNGRVSTVFKPDRSMLSVDLTNTRRADAPLVGASK